MTSQTSEQSPTRDLGPPLRRYRYAAIVTGIGLLLLVITMIIKYGFGYATPVAVYSPIHGVLYMIYVAMTIDLAIKARWSIKGIVAVLLAGCVPFVSFVAERQVTRRVTSGQRV